MSETSRKLLCEFLPAEKVREIDHWVSKYPSDQQQSAVMSALRIVQEEHGHLTPQYMDAVAEYLNMPAIAVYEVATFYTMYEKNPVGRHTINVCTNVSCMLKGSSEVVDHLVSSLGVSPGETTSDGRFTIRNVECLGACVNAPMMQVDKDYHENLTTDKIDQVLERYK